MQLCFLSLSFCGLWAATMGALAKAPSLMIAVVQEETHGPLTIATKVPTPTPGENEVLIEVHYSSLNRMDLLQAKGKYPLPEGTSDILGVEVSGVVVAAPPSSSIQPNDRVMALLPGGGYAQYCVCDERTVMKLPPQVDSLTAAAIPEAFMTAYQLLFLVGNVQRGESVLLHAAASSVGQAAIQMCVEKGVKVIVTARTQEKVDVCLSLGASAGIVVDGSHLFADEVMARNGGGGVDVILDPVGANYLRDNLKVIKYDGRLVSYGLLSGAVVPPELNSNDSSIAPLLKQMLFKRVSLLASTLRARSLDYKSDLISALMSDQEAGFAAISAGRINVSVSAVFPLHEVSAAHAMMQRNENIGKIVLQVATPSDSVAGKMDL